MANSLGVAPSDRRAPFDRDGFVKISAFATPKECEAMRQRMQELIAAWDPVTTKCTFCTDEKEQEKEQGSSDYFLDSADRIHFFLEKGVAGEDGQLKPGIDKARSLNKVGHGLHVLDEVFRSYTHSAKVVDLVKELGWKDPVLPQSMYIFKQPGIGGEVTTHQDNTFLHTIPRPTCLGLWLALDAATLDNGCLWVRPGSHHEPVRRLFVRNPVHFGGDKSAPQMIFENRCVDTCAAHAWDGKMPDGWEPPSVGLREKGFIPVECEVGDLLAFDGSLDHMSLPNIGPNKRDTFQLHIVDGPAAGITWSERNWLQYPEGRCFPSLGLHADAKRKSSEAIEADVGHPGYSGC